MAYDPSNPHDLPPDPNPIAFYFECESNGCSIIGANVSLRKDAVTLINKYWISSPLNTDNVVPYLAISYIDGFLSTYNELEGLPEWANVAHLAACCYKIASTMRNADFNVNNFLREIDTERSEVEINDIQSLVERWLDIQNYRRPITAICFLNYFASEFRELNEEEKKYLITLATQKLYDCQTDIEYTAMRPSIMAAAALASIYTRHGNKSGDCINTLMNCPYINRENLHSAMKKLRSTNSSAGNSDLVFDFNDVPVRTMVMGYNPSNPYDLPPDPNPIPIYFECESNGCSIMGANVSLRKDAVTLINKYRISSPLQTDNVVPYIAIIYIDSFLSTHNMMEGLPEWANVAHLAACCYKIASTMRNADFNVNNFLREIDTERSEVEINDIQSLIERWLDIQNYRRPITAICFLNYFAGEFTELNEEEKKNLITLATQKLYECQTDIEYTAMRPSIMAAAALASSTSIYTGHGNKSGDCINTLMNCPYINRDNLRSAVKRLSPSTFHFHLQHFPVDPSHDEELVFLDFFIGKMKNLGEDYLKFGQKSKAHDIFQRIQSGKVMPKAFEEDLKNLQSTALERIIESQNECQYTKLKSSAKAAVALGSLCFEGVADYDFINDLLHAIVLSFEPLRAETSELFRFYFTFDSYETRDTTASTDQEERAAHSTDQEERAG